MWTLAIGANIFKWQWIANGALSFSKPYLTQYNLIVGGKPLKSCGAFLLTIQNNQTTVRIENPYLRYGYV